MLSIRSITQKVALFFALSTVAAFEGAVNSASKDVDVHRHLASCPEENKCRRSLFKGFRVHKIDGADCSAKCSLLTKRAVKKGWKCGPCPEDAPVAPPTAIKAPTALVEPPAPAPMVAAGTAAPSAKPAFGSTTSMPTAKAPAAVVSSTQPTLSPVNMEPSVTPSSTPSDMPTVAHSGMPTFVPSQVPTMQDSASPSGLPTLSPNHYEPHNMLISEVMVNPGAVPQGEAGDSRPTWLELYNNASISTNLKGWTVATIKLGWEIQSDLIVSPGEYVVLSSSNASFATLSTDYVLDILSLEAKDLLVLYDPSGSRRDSVDWTQDGFTVEARSLTLSSPMAPNRDLDYWCLSSNVYQKGQSGQSSDQFGTPGAANDCVPATDTVLISEIMVSPTGDTEDSNLDWFEVYNKGPFEVNLKNWRVITRGGDWKITKELLIPPKGYAVFGDKGSIVGGGTSYVLDGFKLRTDIDEIMLENPFRMSHNTVDWNPTWDAWPFPDGASLSLLSLSLKNGDAENWCTSTSFYNSENRGTPGSTNNCQVGDNIIVINEVMIDPVALTKPATKFEKPKPLQWIELFNKGNYDIDLKGWKVVVVGKTFEIAQSFIIPMGSYKVLSGHHKNVTLAQGKFTTDYILDGLELDSSEGVIRLLTPTFAVHDKVTWDETWFVSQSRSIALKTPLLDNSKKDNWCEALLGYNNDDNGTPGIHNDCPLIAITEIMKNPVDGAGQWVELYNRGAYKVGLDGWTLSWSDMGDGFDSAVMPNVVIGPGEFLVVGADSGVARVTVPAFEIPTSHGFVSLLEPNTNKVNDEVKWGVFWPSDGQTMALREPIWGDNDQPLNWCKSTAPYDDGVNYGTPGTWNDCPRIVINEIMIDPDGVDSANEEWVELYNPGPYPVDMTGWKFNVNDNAKPFIVTKEFPLFPPDAYIVLGGPGLDVSFFVDGPPLNNAKGSVQITAPDGVYMDRVEWDVDVDAGWTQLPGSSMALKASHLPSALHNANANAWCRSMSFYDDAGNKGTPGRANDCFGDTLMPILI